MSARWRIPRTPARDSDSRLLDAAEASRVSGYQIGSLRHMARAGRVRAVQAFPGAHWRYPLDEMQALARGERPVGYTVPDGEEVAQCS